MGAEVGRIEPPEDRDLTMWHSVHVRGVATSVSESTLARIFAGCGRVIDCRLSGWDRSRYRFAFVAFASEGEVERALGLDGLVLEGSEIRVQRSKTAIIPVNPDFLPRSEAELERCVAADGSRRRSSVPTSPRLTFMTRSRRCADPSRASTCK